VQSKIWKPHGKTLLCWVFYYVNDNTNVDIENPQIMHCIFCHNNPINVTNPRTQFKRGIISYYKTNGITFLEKHVNVDQVPIAKIFEEEEQFIERK
jgi:hypothetical protein